MTHIEATFYPYGGPYFQRKVKVEKNLYKGFLTPTIVVIDNRYYVRVENYPVYKECEPPYFHVESA